MCNNLSVEIHKRLHELAEIHKKLCEFEEIEISRQSHRGGFELQGGKLLSGFYPRIPPLFSIPVNFY